MGVFDFLRRSGGTATEEREAPSCGHLLLTPTWGNPADMGKEDRATGYPESPGRDPDDRTRDRDPHHALNNPADNPDPTEWPDPYERRSDPRDPPDPDQAPFGASPHPGTAAPRDSHEAGSAVRGRAGQPRLHPRHAVDP